MKKTTILTVLLAGLLPVVLLAQGNSRLLADGKAISELVSDVQTFELQFGISQEAAKGGYGFPAAMKPMLKAKGGADLQYAVRINIKDNSGCGELNPVYEQSGEVKAMGWSNLAKNGETVNVLIKGKDIYDNLNNLLTKCGKTPSALSLDMVLLTLPKSKSSGNSEHELSRISLPVSASSATAMIKGADEKTYNEFLSGNKAHKVRDEALLEAIEDELARLKKSIASDIITIHVQDIYYKDAANTVLTWYAHNIYKNNDGQCKYGYIYGEASKYDGGYSMNYLNGEREEFIGCDYAEKLRNR